MLRYIVEKSGRGYVVIDLRPSHGRYRPSGPLQPLPVERTETKRRALEYAEQYNRSGRLVKNSFGEWVTDNASEPQNV